MHKYYRTYRDHHGRITLEQVSPGLTFISSFLSETHIKEQLRDSPPVVPYQADPAGTVYFSATADGNLSAQALCAQLTLLGAGFKVVPK